VIAGAIITKLSLVIVMAGLVPAIQECVASGSICWHAFAMDRAWVYMMTNRPNGTLYTGVTTCIARRAWEHRECLVPGFTKRYGLKRLVYVDLATNPQWDDLYGHVV
jgi:hypothetical protein